MLEGGEGRTEGALERLGLKAFAKEKAVVLSMGQVGCTILFCSMLCSKFCSYIFLRKWLVGSKYSMWFWVTASCFLNMPLNNTSFCTQRKRLQLARMLAIPRPLWLLDEPSVGLDTEVTLISWWSKLEFLSCIGRSSWSLCVCCAYTRWLSVSYHAWKVMMAVISWVNNKNGLWYWLNIQGVRILEELMDEHRSRGGMVFVATHVPINLPDAMHMTFPPRLVSTAKLRILQCAVVATKSSVLVLLNHGVYSEFLVFCNLQ